MRTILLLMILSTSAIAQEMPAYGEKAYRVGGYYQWQYSPKTSKRADKGDWVWHAVPPQTPLNAPPAHAVPSTPRYRLVMALPGGFKPGKYTISFLYNGKETIDKGCTDLHVVDYILHYKHRGNDRALSYATEWQAVSEDTQSLPPDPPADDPNEPEKPPKAEPIGELAGMQEKIKEHDRVLHSILDSMNAGLTSQAASDRRLREQIGELINNDKWIFRLLQEMSSNNPFGLRKEQPEQPKP